SLALDGARRGDDVIARQALEASWKLDGALLDRREIVSQSLGVSLLRLEASVLRKIPPTMEAWPHGFGERDLEAALVRAIAYEAWGLRERAKPSHREGAGASLPLRWIGRGMRFATSPTNNLVSAEIQEGLR